MDKPVFNSCSFPFFPPIFSSASPFSVILARIAAPKATASSTLTPPNVFLLDMVSTYFRTIGILVEPPTKITPSISFQVISKDSSKRFVTSLVVPIKNSDIDSNVSSVISIAPLTPLYARGTVTLVFAESCFFTDSAVTNSEAAISGSSVKSCP